MRFRDRLRHAWDAFSGRVASAARLGPSYGSRPDKMQLSYGTERSMVSAIYNRIAIDAAAIGINHVQTNQNGSFESIIPSKLNNCLTINANEDQTGRAFIQDVVFSMLDEGYIGIVPTHTTISPNITEGFDIEEMRVGQILEWMPHHVRLKCYNENSGYKEEIVLPKKFVAIVENPLYTVMNEPFASLKRLTRKLMLLDKLDEQQSSGKLDLIMQLPYKVTSEIKRQAVKKRIADLEDQLASSKYGIGWIDATEHITQLNRAVENNLLEQIQYLTTQVLTQMGLTENIMNGTASEEEKIEYYNRTIEPILSAITDAMKWKFLTKTARTQGKSIMFFRDPFKLIPIAKLAEICDKLTRNEIMTTNEVRARIGMKPSDDPRADELRNKNLNEQTPSPAVGQNESNFEKEGKEDV